MPTWCSGSGKPTLRSGLNSWSATLIVCIDFLWKCGHATLGCLRINEDVILLLNIFQICPPWACVNLRPTTAQHSVGTNQRRTFGEHDQGQCSSWFVRWSFVKKHACVSGVIKKKFVCGWSLWFELNKKSKLGKSVRRASLFNPSWWNVFVNYGRE